MAVQHGVAHYDVRMSALRALDPDTRNAMLAILWQAPKPLLIHCRSGADRTGLIAALYLFAIEGQQAETAVQQLSLSMVMCRISGAGQRPGAQLLALCPLQ